MLGHSLGSFSRWVILMLGHKMLGHSDVGSFCRVCKRSGHSVGSSESVGVGYMRVYEGLGSSESVGVGRSVGSG